MSRASIIDELAEMWAGKCVKCADCCRECLKRKGYFSDEAFAQVEHYGFAEKGFLGDEGCRIPLHERSYTCITHLCPTVVRKIPQIERNLFAVLAKELKALEAQPQDAATN